MPFYAAPGFHATVIRIYRKRGKGGDTLSLCLLFILGLIGGVTPVPAPRGAGRPLPIAIAANATTAMGVL